MDLNTSESVFQERQGILIPFIVHLMNIVKLILWLIWTHTLGKTYSFILCQEKNIYKHDNTVECPFM